MRQRSDGKLVKFAPYSSALGAVMVGSKSGIASLGDLKGKAIGVWPVVRLIRVGFY